MERKPPRRVYRSRNKDADSVNQVGSKGSDTRGHRAQPHRVNSPPNAQTKGAQSQRPKPSAEKYVPPFRRGKARATYSSKAHNPRHRGERDFKTNNAPLRADQRWNWRRNQQTNRRANQRASQTLTAHIEDNLVGLFIGSGGKNITAHQDEINAELASIFRATHPKQDKSAALTRWVRLSVCSGERPNTSVVKIQCRNGTQAQAETALHLVQNIMDLLRIKVKEKEERIKKEEEHIKELVMMEQSRQHTRVEGHISEGSSDVSAPSPSAKLTSIPPKSSRLTDDIFFRIVARYAYPSSRGDQETVAVVREAIETALASRILVKLEKSDVNHEMWIVNDRASTVQSWFLAEHTYIKPALRAYADKLIAVSLIFHRTIVVHADNEQQEVLDYLSPFFQNLSPDMCADLCPGACRNSGRNGSHRTRSEAHCFGPIRLMWGDEGWSTRRPSALLIKASKGQARRVSHKDLLCLKLKYHRNTQVLWDVMRRLDIQVCDSVFAHSYESLGETCEDNSQCLCGSWGGWDDEGKCVEPDCNAEAPSLYSHVCHTCHGPLDIVEEPALKDWVEKQYFASTVLAVRASLRQFEVLMLLLQRRVGRLCIGRLLWSYCSWPARAPLPPFPPPPYGLAAVVVSWDAHKGSGVIAPVKGGPHIDKGSLHIAKGSPHIIKGDPHIIKGDPHIAKGDPHIAKGDSHIVVPWYSLRHPCRERPSMYSSPFICAPDQKCFVRDRKMLYLKPGETVHYSKKSGIEYVSGPGVILREKDKPDPNKRPQTQRNRFYRR